VGPPGKQGLVNKVFRKQNDPTCQINYLSVGSELFSFEYSVDSTFSGTCFNKLCPKMHHDLQY